MAEIACGYGGEKVDFTQKYIVGPLLYFCKKAQAGLPVNAGKTGETLPQGRSTYKT
ncbi:hypothetical protein [Neisseria elongata]|uniref:hypothetical protein n=1 Tax=Neisseria elongata TaxID=495 RepID=UPI000ABF34BD|nr:hypothetical protein [Neisseria elongata]